MGDKKDGELEGWATIKMENSKDGALERWRTRRMGARMMEN